VPARKKSPSDRRLETALAAVTGALTRAGAPWMVIGGIAAIARGTRRTTTDIDVVVQRDAISLDALVRHLAKGDVVPRIPDAKAFAETSLVLLVRHEPTGVDLDIALGWTKFEEEAIAHSTLVAFGSVTAPMATPRDLIVLKALAGRPKDIDDATSLWLTHPAITRDDIRASIVEFAELAEDPSFLEGFEAIVKRLREVAPPPKRKRR